jgi:carbon starvation protein CstA
MITFGVLLYSLRDAEGFKVIWRYFAWCNQTLSVFTLWAITVYLVRSRKNFYIALLPALLMTLVCSTYICIAPEGLSLSKEISYIIGSVCTMTALVWFITWYRKALK